MVIPSAAPSRWQPWQEENLARITRRLRPGVAAPQGLIERRSRSGFELLTIKEDSQIQLYFAAADGSAERSGIMSRVDLNRPLYLLGIYTRAMVGALMWKPDAQRVCQIGFGGGRIPMVLHHYFPDMVIESTEIDAEVVRMARRWFGIEPDKRMVVFTEEGRGYLCRQAPTVAYDIILVDCFTGSGQHPYSLSTVEFYEEVRSHLASDGVVATNLVASDPMFERKVATMQAGFAHVWCFASEGADVFFGSDEPVGSDMLRARAELVLRGAPFTFPFLELLDDMRECPPSGLVNVLTDGRREHAAPDDLMFQSARRNDPCPCGSGKKFKNCHGR